MRSGAVAAPSTMARVGTHYAVEEVADGVYAAIHRPGGFGISNSGIVDLGGPGVVFDTGMSPTSAAELWTLASGSLGQPPALAANSHWHFDHSLGNARFATLPIWGTRRTREILRERREEFLRELERPELERAREQLEARRASMPPGPPTVDLEMNLLLVLALLDAEAPPVLHPPDRTFETRVALPGTRGAELRSFGSGHTEADAILHLPAERVVFTGDLVCLGIEPSLGSGDPVHWLTVLDELEALRPERIVPGHGPVSGPDRIGETREYLAGVLEAARAPPGAPVPSAIRKWDGSVGLEENLAFTRQWVASHEGRR